MLDITHKRFLVTGGSGFIGSHVVQKLLDRGVPQSNIIIPRSTDCDLRVLENCTRIVQNIDFVIHLAAYVGGVQVLRDEPGRIFYDNAMMSMQLIEEARKAGVEKFVSFGTLYCYSDGASVPLDEKDIWNGYPKAEIASYGIVKRMLHTQLQAYKSQYDFNGLFLILANIYGPGDTFDLVGGKVLPSLIRKVLEAQDAGRDSIEVWGSGQATRDFLYVEDAATGIVQALEDYDSPEPVNIGAGRETSIKELVETICRVTGFSGDIAWDTTKPEGQLRFCVNIDRARREFGFEPTIELERGIARTVEWYKAHRAGILSVS